MIAWAETDDDGGTRVRIADLSATGEPRDLAAIPMRLHPEATLAFAPDDRSLVLGGFVASDDRNAIAVITLD